MGQKPFLDTIPMLSYSKPSLGAEPAAQEQDIAGKEQTPETRDLWAAL